MNAQPFKVGDIVKVSTRDPQEKKVHSSAFEGVIISQKGTSTDRTFTVRKKATDGVFVERIFPLESPTIEKIQVIKQNDVRRAKLYYLRKKLKK